MGTIPAIGRNGYTQQPALSGLADRLHGTARGRRLAARIAEVLHRFCRDELQPSSPSEPAAARGNDYPRALRWADRE